MTIKRRTKTGQAMMELLMGLIALIVIMVGIVTFGEGGYHWLSSMVEAAGAPSQAWEKAISDQSVQLANSSPAQPFIQTWDNGSDQIAYTMDDQRVAGDPSAFFATATRVLSSPIDYPHYNASFIQNNFALNLNANTTATQGWLLGQSAHNWALGRIDRQNGKQPIDFGNAFQALAYGKDSITIQSEVYLPPLSNLQ